MKEKCDNNCATCTMQSQVFCALVFAKENNAAMADISERLRKMESKMGGEVTYINPLQRNSAMPPAPELEGNF